MFHEAVGLTGLVLTKLDGTAKGGIAIRIYQELGVPDQAGRSGRADRGSPALRPEDLRGRAREATGMSEPSDAAGFDGAGPPVDGARADPRGARRGSHVAESAWSARSWSRRTPWSAQGVSHERAGDAHAEVAALAEAGPTGARGHALRHARALQPSRGARRRAWTPSSRAGIRRVVDRHARSESARGGRREPRALARGRRRGRPWAVSSAKRASSTARSSPRSSAAART